MKKVLLSVVAATLCATSALAADLKPVLKAPPPPPPSPWDVAFGAALMSDYNFRGISQSNRGPSVTAYSETRYNVNSNFQLYAGSQYWAVTLPTNPTCECDLYAGIRPTLGAFAFDFGYIYYWYPKEKQHASFSIPPGPFPNFPNGNSTLKDTDYWEVYGKVAWDVVKDKFALGANVYYSPDWLNTGSYGLYASGTAKFTGPSFKLNIGAIDEVGWYLSGELGHYWFGTTDLVPGVFSNLAGTAGIPLPDYTFWNVGIAFTWKVFTLDLRYYDTDLSKSECNVLTGDPNAIVTASGAIQSKWCNAAFIAALKFDLTLANLKP
jgi:opacity protein-like surface antigen